MAFPFVEQHEQMDCGIACLEMIRRYYALEAPEARWTLAPEGLSIKSMLSQARRLHLEGLAVRLPFVSAHARSLQDAPLPAIAYLPGDQGHFVVIYRIKKGKVYLADPAVGRYWLSRKAFEEKWLLDKSEAGILLLFEPTEAAQRTDSSSKSTTLWSHISVYFWPYRGLFLRLLGFVFLMAVIQLLFPLLTQAIVDKGIARHDLSLIYLILLGQILLVLGQVSLQFLQAWLLLKIGTRAHIQMVADFLLRLIELPRAFYMQRSVGDFMTRVQDYRRIEQLFTATALRASLATLSFLVFSGILLYYHPLIFGVFLFGSVLYIGWIFRFLRKRKQLDYMFFQLSAKHQNQLLEWLEGFTDLKIYQGAAAAHQRWLALQETLFALSQKQLRLHQQQEAGALFIQQTKNLGITALAAYFVIEGKLSLGMMLAIQFILGQLNAPLNEFIRCIRQFQDSQISLARVSEMQTLQQPKQAQTPAPKPITSIQCEALTFTYPNKSQPVFTQLTCAFPVHQRVALVGASGSGKSTLLQLLLGFLEPQHGQILLNTTPLTGFAPSNWQRQYSAVLPDSRLFSTSLLENITMGHPPNMARLEHIAHLTCLHTLLDQLPHRWQSTLGHQGTPISQGQTQRVLLARALYADTPFVFLDEATNAIDAPTESLIFARIAQHMPTRSFFFIAHRWSCIRHAQHIVFLNANSKIDQGKHQKLLNQNTEYKDFIQAQQ